MTRKPLPARRPSQNVEIEWRGQTYHLTIGYDPETGDAKEVFGSSKKIGTDLAHLIADACVVISIALQHGVTKLELIKSLGITPDPLRGDQPASLIGAIIKELPS